MSTPPVTTWPVEEVERFFLSLRLHECIEHIQKKQLDGCALIDLVERDGLKELGLSGLHQSKVRTRLAKVLQQQQPRLYTEPPHGASLGGPSYSSSSPAFRAPTHTPEVRFSGPVATAPPRPSPPRRPFPGWYSMQDLASDMVVKTLAWGRQQGEVHHCVQPRFYRRKEQRDGGKTSGDSSGVYNPGYELDWYQERARECLLSGESVLVAAPTSAGKTTVALDAISVCLSSSPAARCVYTAPIKALANQKYTELIKQFGASCVCLMTGDSVVGDPSGARLMVMTTEILRSVLYGGRLREDDQFLKNLRVVVFDEVHYLGDQSRGVVWEETIVLLERHVTLVCLSATTPNALEIAGWLAQVRSEPCHAIICLRRPVPLEHHLYACPTNESFCVIDEKGKFCMETFARANKALPKVPAKGAVEKRPSEIKQLLQQCLDEQGLPLIVFSFSRQQCVDLAMGIAGEINLRSAERQQVKTRVAQVLNKLVAPQDLTLQSIRQVTEFFLPRGIGVHHSGMLPFLRELTETLFEEGLVRILFATETFGLGVNMPSRSVCFNWTPGREFTKYAHGQRRVKASEYLQMSGRAGRRGKDVKGKVVNMITAQIDGSLFEILGSGQAEPVPSRFRIRYGMLLECLRWGRGTLEMMLLMSFQQFQTDFTKPVLQEECERKISFLQALGLLDRECHPTRAGRAARKVQATDHELLVATWLLEGGLDGAEPEGLAAYFSCLSADQEAHEEVPLPSSEGSLLSLQQGCERQIASLCRRGAPLGVFTDASQIRGQLRKRATACEAVLMWQRGGTFRQTVSAARGLSEGEVARVIRRTYTLMRSVEASIRMLETEPDKAEGDEKRQARQELLRVVTASRKLLRRNEKALPFLESIFFPEASCAESLDGEDSQDEGPPCAHEPSPNRTPVWLSPDEIGFSRSSISFFFRHREGYAVRHNLASTLLQLCRRHITPERLLQADPLRIYWLRGRFYSLGNRRLALFRLFQQLCPYLQESQSIPVIVIGREEAEAWGWQRKFSAGLWQGRSIRIRETGETVGSSIESTVWSFGQGLRRDWTPGAPSADSQQTLEKLLMSNVSAVDWESAYVMEEEDDYDEPYVAIPNGTYQAFAASMGASAEANPTPYPSQTGFSKCGGRSLLTEVPSGRTEGQKESFEKEMDGMTQGSGDATGETSDQECEEPLQFATVTKVIDPQRLCEYVLTRNLVKGSAQYIGNPATILDLRRGAAEVSLPEEIPERHLSIHSYCHSFALPLLDDTRSSLEKALDLKTIDTSPWVEVELKDPSELKHDLGIDRVTKVPAFLAGFPHFAVLFGKSANEWARQQMQPYRVVLLSIANSADALRTEDDHTLGLLMVSKAEHPLVILPPRWQERPQAVPAEEEGRLGPQPRGTWKQLSTTPGTSNGDLLTIGGTLANRASRPSEALARFCRRPGLRLTLLENDLSTAIRIASAIAAPDMHMPVFWSEQVSGHSEELTTFTNIAKEDCKAMHEGDAPSLSQLDNLGLNSSQKHAVEGALTMEQGIYCIQGPPGTGKTHMLAVLLELAVQRNSRSLVCAPTNVALGALVDRMLSRRFWGSGARPSSTLHMEALLDDDGRGGKATYAEVAAGKEGSDDQGAEASEEEDRSKTGQTSAYRWSLSQVALVTSEERMQVGWETDRSRVFLDHRKKRIKRVARWYLGEGMRCPRPFLEQPPWTELGRGSLNVLLSDPTGSWFRWRQASRGRSLHFKQAGGLSTAWDGWCADGIGPFLRHALSAVLRVMERHIIVLKEDVPADDARVFPPRHHLNKEERKAWSAMLHSYKSVQKLRQRLQAASAALRKLVAAVRQNAETFDAGVAPLEVLAEALAIPKNKGKGKGKPQYDGGGSPHRASGGYGSEESSSTGTSFPKCEGKVFHSACKAVESAAREDLDPLLDLLGLRAMLDKEAISGVDADGDRATIIRKGERQLKFMLHPDRLQDMEKRCTAEIMFKKIDEVWAKLEKALAVEADGAQPTSSVAEEQREERRAAQEFAKEASTESTWNQVFREALCAAAASAGLGDAALRELSEALASLRMTAASVRITEGRYLRAALLRHAVLVFSTVNVSGRSAVQEQEIPTVLIDEAAQIHEAGTLVVLRSDVERLILVGDPRQLPAVVSSDKAKKAHFQRSLLERLQLIGHAPKLLDLQYRMHEDIVAFSNETFYEGLVKTDVSVCHRSPVLKFDMDAVPDARWRFRLGPVRIFDTSRFHYFEEEERDGPSCYNVREAECVLQTLEYFVRHCNPSDQLLIGIVTPYNAQVRHFTRELEKSTNKERAWIRAHCQIRSVEAFQGNECDIIVISAVKSLEKPGRNSAKFLNDNRRLNVAITRGRLRVWVFGCMHTLEKLGAYRCQFNPALGPSGIKFRGLEVWDTDGQALALGIEKGWAITAVDGCVVHTGADAEETITGLERQGKPFNVTFTNKVWQRLGRFARQRGWIVDAEIDDKAQAAGAVSVPPLLSPDAPYYDREAWFRRMEADGPWIERQWDYPTDQWVVMCTLCNRYADEAHLEAPLHRCARPRAPPLEVRLLRQDNTFGINLEREVVPSSAPRQPGADQNLQENGQALFRLRIAGIAAGGPLAASNLSAPPGAQVPVGAYIWWANGEPDVEQIEHILETAPIVDLVCAVCPLGEPDPHPPEDVVSNGLVPALQPVPAQRPNPPLPTEPPPPLQPTEPPPPRDPTEAPSPKQPIETSPVKQTTEPPPPTNAPPPPNGTPPAANTAPPPPPPPRSGAPGAQSSVPPPPPSSARPLSSTNGFSPPSTFYSLKSDPPPPEASTDFALASAFLPRGRRNDSPPPSSDLPLKSIFFAPGSTHSLATSGDLPPSSIFLPPWSRDLLSPSKEVASPPRSTQASPPKNDSPAQQIDAPLFDSELPPRGFAGAEWLASGEATSGCDGQAIKVRKDLTLNSEVVGNVVAGQVVHQQGDWVRLPEGLIRMQVSAVPSFGWITANGEGGGMRALEMKNEGTVQQLQHPAGHVGARWHVRAPVHIQASTDTKSKTLFLAEKGVLLRQVGPAVQADGGPLRLPVQPIKEKMNAVSGWITLDAQARGGPRFLKMQKQQRPDGQTPPPPPPPAYEAGAPVQSEPTRTAGRQSTDDRPVCDRPTGDRLASERSTGARPPGEQLTGARPAGEGPAGAPRPAAERPAASVRIPAEPPAVARPPAQQPAVARPPAERPVAARPLGVQPLVDRSANEPPPPPINPPTGDRFANGPSPVPVPVGDQTARPWSLPWSEMLKLCPPGKKQFRCWGCWKEFHKEWDLFCHLRHKAGDDKHPNMAELEAYNAEFCEEWFAEKRAANASAGVPLALPASPPLVVGRSVASMGSPPPPPPPPQPPPPLAKTAARPSGREVSNGSGARSKSVGVASATVGFSDPGSPPVVAENGSRKQVSQKGSDGGSEWKADGLDRANGWPPPGGKGWASADKGASSDWPAGGKGWASDWGNAARIRQRTVEDV